MIHRTSIAVWLMFWAGISVAAPQAASEGTAGSTQQPKTAPKSGPMAKGPTSLVGCVDEQEGLWVLLNDQTRSVIASLAAEGFPMEGFAKYLGHKVTVRGTVSSSGPNTLFKVRNVETISETCASQ